MSSEFTINVSKLEDLQTIGDVGALEIIFEKARRTVIGGGVVLLVRQAPDGVETKFDEISAEEDLAVYKVQVFKYLDAE